jgi:hypothetical protein
MQEIGGGNTWDSIRKEVISSSLASLLCSLAAISAACHTQKQNFFDSIFHVFSSSL